MKKPLHNIELSVDEVNKLKERFFKLKEHL
jgi:hypothetical protein